MTYRFVTMTIDVLLRFVRRKEGNVAMIFGLLLVPMLGAIGLSVDFGHALAARNKGQAAADAAALQAAGVARDLIKISDGSPAASTAALAEAKQRAIGLFQAFTQQDTSATYGIDVTVTRDGQSISSTASFSAETQTYLAGLFGKRVLSASGRAVTSSSLPTYADIYIAMDQSQSMGIAATDQAMKDLFKKTSCVFGCHVPESGHSVSNEKIAKDNGIPLRIDVLRDATVKMIATAEKDAGGSAAYRFAVYTMGANPSSPTTAILNEVSPLSSNFTSLKQKASTISLGFSTTANGYGDSNLHEQIVTLSGIIPKPGDGSSQGKSNGYLFIMTDGVRDIVGSGGNCTWGHCMSTIDPAICKQVKDKKIIVGVLYTTYLPIYVNPANPSGGYDDRYKQLILNKNIIPNIRPHLQECASPGWFFEASDASGIDQAMAKMFEQTTNAPALTQ